MANLMRAMQIEKYGHVALVSKQVPVPEIGANDVLVAIRAASVNPIDFKTHDGEVKLLVKHQMPLTLGHDFSGVIVKVGKQVTKFKVGDEVYGRPRDSRIGTFAEYLAVNANDIALKPGNLTFVEAAAIPLVALTSYQALIDIAKLKPHQKVFIQAGAGGVGSIAIQLAKILGAYVATTTSAKNEKWVRTLGTDQIIDYHKQDFETALKDYDMVFDTLGGQQLRKAFKVVKPHGTIVSLSGLPNAKFARERKLGWFKTLLFGLVTLNLSRLERRSKVSYDFLFMQASGKELEQLTKWIEAGKIKPVVDKVFTLRDAQKALNYSEKGHAQGKIIIKVSE
ncbi:NADP-dependent oxidoreductase [Pediococcus ethanolidurans]|uniref:NADP-dependent oxidoreductase n=2 Tax=Pediococcus ethanolidurans TaxID=319653 RepID=UPI0020A7A550|nr:NADP-dependent oxidoreductase [Pediococcus ethanolidurans]MCV3315453.1 NADP-dependent oxidoreductase [Pediococcus ethanolidurans]MCV3554826.1 NADP-dependent oxidoreductase [Pediococcus ethanolidurans]